ncbi:hypothetical protein PYW07_011550 [Mythimna separata]|uniref:N-acetyltransferase domain-containing protein n=1 Tax=Mythimna separata TaxID=271217 RepID=A0AAD7Y9W8_MYTSE|nr:hypothetical protein PYW07_011550 [Mythimna separata]
MPFVRPASLPIGQVWSRFKGRERNGKPALMYQIRDMDESIRKICLDMMEETFLRDEPLCDILGINKDPVSIATIRANWEAYVSMNTSLACYTEEDGQPKDLVGFNIVFVKSKDDEEEDFDQVQGESWKKLLRTLITAEELLDVFQHYNVDKYMTSSGLTVLPEYRGQNIGAKFIEARTPLCAALGIKAAATVFTASASQVLAAKCGYEVLAELDYADMKKQGIDLTGCPTPTAKLMGFKFK